MSMTQSDIGMLMQSVETALNCSVISLTVDNSFLNLHLTLANRETRTSSGFLDILKTGVPKDTNVRGKILEKRISKNCDKCGKVVQEKGREICVVIEINDETAKCLYCVEDKSEKVQQKDQSSNSGIVSSASFGRNDIKIHAEGSSSERNDIKIDSKGSSASSFRNDTTTDAEGSEVCLVDCPEQQNSVMNEDESETNKQSLLKTISDQDEHCLEKSVKFSCLLCKNSFRSKHLFQKHLKSHGEKPFKCSLCGKQFPGQLNYIRHMKIHKNICKICGKSYRTAVLLSTHMFSHQESTEKKFICQTCGKAFTAVAYLQKHLKRHKNRALGISPKQRLYTCSLCGEKLATQVYLRKHMEVHTKGKNKASHVGSNESRQKTRGQNNRNCIKIESVKVETDLSTKSVDTQRKGLEEDAERPEIMGKESETNESCALNVEPDTNVSCHTKQKKRGSGENKDGDLNTDRDEVKVNSEDNIRTYIRKAELKSEKVNKCKFCNASFTNMKALHQHYERLHSVSEGEKTFLCHICGKAFSSQENVNKHVKTNCTFSESEKQKCSVCNKTLSNSVALERHMLHHTADRKHMCELCGKCFLTDASLRTHIICHTENRRHKCDICGRGYRNVWTMKVHRKTHTGENLLQCPDCKDWFVNESYLNNQHKIKYCKARRKCSCEICGREFNEPRDLKSHVGYHTGERPYMCGKCGKAFAKLPSRDDHYSRHFDKLNFKCQYCERSFKRRPDLKKHIKLHVSADDMHLKKYNLPPALKPKDVPQNVIITEQELDEATILITDVPRSTHITEENVQMDATEVKTEPMNLTHGGDEICITDLSSFLSCGQVAVTIPSSHVTSGEEEITVVLPSELAEFSQNISISESGEIVMVAMDLDGETK